MAVKLSVLSFPLRKVTEGHLLQLSQELWSWQPCTDCYSGKRCLTEGCSAKRASRPKHFFEYYKSLAASYEPDIGRGEQPALRTHEDVIAIIKTLKSEPQLVRAKLQEKIIANRSADTPPGGSDLDGAVNLAVRTMTMINCAAQHQSLSLLEPGTYRIPWRSHVTFAQFITDAFPTTDHPIINDDDFGSPRDIKSALMARKLKKRIRLKIRPTDDLRSHLKLDRKKHSVEIFHHTAFLKEHLRLSINEPRHLTESDYVKLSALPRQLALECLDSIQKILFPLSDPKSRSLLLSLISCSGFDPDCLRFESASIRKPDEKDIAYHYFGARLADLFEELENPKPRGLVEEWLERKSGARYIMMATLIGVIFAVVLGIASLAVSGYQAWLQYQQWQHPTGNSGQ